MKIFFSFLIVLLLSATPFGAQGEEYGAIRLSLQEGDIRVYSQDDNEWIPASVNMPLGPGDRISVPYGGRGELQIIGGVYLRLDSDTRLEIVSLSSKEAHFYLDQGHIYINNRRGGIQTVQIDTPLATATTRDNSICLVDVEDSGTTELAAIKGSAFMESQQGKTRVSAGTTLRIDDHGAELSPIASPDEWERWNSQRDRKALALADSVRYLPDELHDYANDLDESGRWLFVREYGYVWTPAVVSVEWAPFRIGQWLWVRGDYTWISNERWGWAPYHYGRWVHVSGTGWCWVPPAANAVSWGPGYVAWVSTSSTIGWVPLAPGETYYGRRNYGPGTVILSDKSKGHSVPTRSYRNSRVYNGVTVVQANTFNRRDREHTIIRDTRLQQHSWSPSLPPAAARAPHQSGSPQQPPRRDSHRTEQAPPKTVVFPVVPAPGRQPAVGQPAPQAVPGRQSSPAVTTQQAPATHAPSRQQRDGVKQPRPFVRDSNQSVFRNDQPQQLPVRKLEEPKQIRRTQQPERRQPEVKGNKPVPAPVAAPEPDKGRGVTKGRKDVQ